MTDIRYSGREGQVTCTPHAELNPGSTCVATIGDLVTFSGQWGSETVLVDCGEKFTTLTFQEVKALERALNLMAHVITRTGHF